MHQTGYDTSDLNKQQTLWSNIQGLEYSGAMLNYGCLAAAVFGGAWADAGGSPGGLAGRVSVASFYLLMLVYSFTQVCVVGSRWGLGSGLRVLVARRSRALCG